MNESAQSLTLPSPPPEAQQASATLCADIRRAIADAGGVLPFDEYMRRCLYTPGLGYYAGGSVKIGAAGDFVTAPEMGPLFAQAIAGQIATVLDDLGPIPVLEFGGGTGRLAGDLLVALAASGSPMPTSYVLIEPSADLKQRQQALLRQEYPKFHDVVTWWDGLPASPLRAVVIANEVLDALPVKVFEISDDGCRELGIADDANGFTWQSMAPSSALAARVASLCGELPWSLPVGYRSELGLWQSSWINTLAAGLSEGLILLADYGYPAHEYYHPERGQGTLMCHYRHRAHDNPLLWPGLQDITASVDFTAVADAAHEAGLDVIGYTTQAHFLLGGNLGPAGGAAASAFADPHNAGAARQLLLPGQMGERFKLMALGRGIRRPLPGFALFDQRHRLLPPLSG
ncbi:MAG: SAM-dependent methyltransferase [Gammaproteobacteria bacterium]|nr:SAM-dependent methyltransferase [Gammaproteobacteria bacterium]